MKYIIGLMTGILLVMGCSKESPVLLVIAVNEVGYDSHTDKVALLVNIDPDTLVLVDEDSGNIVLQKAVKASFIMDESSGDFVTPVNFSEVTTEGRYYFRLKAAGINSSIFVIAENIHKNVVKNVAESFYYQRCDVVNSGKTGWGHPRCHTKPAIHYDNSSLSENITGGWHDAGDYNRFSVTTAVSAAMMLYLYEHYSEYYSELTLDIPGESDQTPDILKEARWGLEWLLKMQRSDGGIYHKISIKKWSGENLPHLEEEPQYLFTVSSSATGSFAAVVAVGSRIFSSFDPEFSRELEQAALNAWSFLEEQPVTVPLGGFINPPDVSGGEYRDNDDRDERLWAAVELYRSTGLDTFLIYFHDRYKWTINKGFPAVSWQNVGTMAFYSYLSIPDDELTAFLEDKAHITERIHIYEKSLINRRNENGYFYILDKTEYYWGSNSVAMGHTYSLIQAYRLTRNPEYIHAAGDQIHYMLGRNPNQISYITGLGYRSIQNPYHQFSMLYGGRTPVAGLLVGGPNNSSFLKNRQLSTFPAKNYQDSEKNYFVNEPAINYTASFLYSAGAIAAINSINSN